MYLFSQFDSEIWSQSYKALQVKFTRNLTRKCSFGLVPGVKGYALISH